MNNTDNIKPSKQKKVEYRLPLWSWVLFALAGVSAVLYIIMMLSEPFSDWFNQNISMFLRFLLGGVTSIAPFSIAEAMIILLPLGATVLIIYAAKKRCDTWKNVGIFLLTLLSAFSILFSLFVFNFAAGYRATPIDEKMQLDRTNIKPEELYVYTALVAKELNDLSGKVDFEEDGFSVMPYSLSEMNSKLIDAYDKASEKYDLINNFPTRVKPVMLSEGMSYLHITGVYTFFTGEANLNIGFPDYTLPYTAAHELAHQRGFAREDEANFVAFLVCSSSDDDYIRYCAYVNMYEYMSNSLYKADRDLYFATQYHLPAKVVGEMNAYSEFYKKYKNSPAADVSGAVNNVYLQSQGTQGTVSYGMVTELAVGYFRKNSP